MDEAHLDLDRNSLLREYLESGSLVIKRMMLGALKDLLDEFPIVGKLLKVSWRLLNAV